MLQLPLSLGEPHTSIEAATALFKAAKEDAERHCDALDAREVDDLKKALGAGTTGRKPRNLDAAVKELEREQKLRRTRVQRDSIDRALVDVLALYRDVLMVQLGVDTDLVNEEMRASVHELAAGSRPESTVRRMEAVMATREALQANALLPLALEALALTLREG
jgi:DNA polymerase-3 subunit delta'